MSHHTDVDPDYRQAILRAASRVPIRLRHSYLRNRIRQIRCELAYHDEPKFNPKTREIHT